MDWLWHDILAQGDSEWIGQVIGLVVLLLLALAASIAGKVKERAERRHAEQQEHRYEQEHRAARAHGQSAPPPQRRSPEEIARQMREQARQRAEAARQQAFGRVPIEVRPAPPPVAPKVRALSPREIEQERRRLLAQQQQRRRQQPQPPALAEIAPEPLTTAEAAELRLELTGEELRRAIVYREILGPPVALRGTEATWDL